MQAYHLDRDLDCERAWETFDFNDVDFEEFDYLEQEIDTFREEDAGIQMIICILIVYLDLSNIRAKLW